MKKGNTKMLVDTYRKGKKKTVNRSTSIQKDLSGPLNPRATQATITQHCFPKVMEPTFKMLRFFAPNGKYLRG